MLRVDAVEVVEVFTWILFFKNLHLNKLVILAFM